jgi:hypothetical protein
MRSGAKPPPLRGAHAHNDSESATSVVRENGDNFKGADIPILEDRPLLAFCPI